MADPSMELSELNSFVGKFLRLWQSGFDATLSLESNAGEAVINMKVGLGKGSPIPHHQFHHQYRAPVRVPGPSQQRRHQCRADARRVTAAEAVNSDNKDNSAVAEEAIDKVNATNEVAEEATDKLDAFNKVAEEAADK